MHSSTVTFQVLLLIIIILSLHLLLENTQKQKIHTFPNLYLLVITQITVQNLDLRSAVTFSLQ